MLLPERQHSGYRGTTSDVFDIEEVSEPSPEAVPATRSTVARRKRRENEGINTGTTVNDVIASTGIEEVISITAIEIVIAATANELVFALTTWSVLLSELPVIWSSAEPPVMFSILRRVSEPSPEAALATRSMA